MHIAIFGGGLGGMSVARELHKSVPSRLNLQITIIDPKPYFEINWASVRAMFDENIRNSHILSREKWLKSHSIQYFCAKLISLTPTNAILDNGESITFDIGIIAVGAHTNIEILHPNQLSTNIQSRKQILQDEGEKLLKANHVLVVGGGGIGCDVAGDIAGFAARQPTTNSRPQVTLVHSGSHLIPEFHESAASKLATKMRNLGINLILNDKVIQKDNNWQLEKSGTILQPDVVVKCVGLFPHNEFMIEGDLAECLDEKGWIKTDDHLRVQGSEGRLFAFGDCCTTQAKTGQVTLLNKSVVAYNAKISLICIADGQDLDKLAEKMKTHLSAPVYCALAGPGGGVAQTPLCTDSWILPALKNKTMFLFRAKSEAGI